MEKAISPLFNEALGWSVSQLYVLFENSIKTEKYTEKFVKLREKNMSYATCHVTYLIFHLSSVTAVVKTHISE